MRASARRQARRLAANADHKKALMINTESKFISYKPLLLFLTDTCASRAAALLSYQAGSSHLWKRPIQ